MLAVFHASDRIGLTKACFPRIAKMRPYTDCQRHSWELEASKSPGCGCESIVYSRSHGNPVTKTRRVPSAF